MKRAGFRAAIPFVLLWTLFPLYWGLLLSFTAPGSTFSVGVLPVRGWDATLDHWRTLLDNDEFPRAMVVSAANATCSSSLAVALGFPAAYGFARLQFSPLLRAGAITGLFLLRLIPSVVLVSPYILMLREFGLYDSIAGLVLANTTLILPLALLILFVSLREIPRSLEDASSLDGASTLTTVLRVVTPLMAPALAATWILCFAFGWSESMLASALSTSDAKSMPVLVLATGGGGGVNFGAATTRSLMLIVVPIVLTLAAQRFIVRGLSLGAVKG